MFLLVFTVITNFGGGPDYLLTGNTVAAIPVHFKNFIHLAYLLEDVLHRKVELITPESLSPYLKPHILKEIEYVL
ncbi:MAG: hypothetical protein HZC49_06605 [Nitrospirae bacterium]|nr:hypothetical protein [Nitrospirota bacterium]